MDLKTSLDEYFIFEKGGIHAAALLLNNPFILTGTDP